MKRNKKGFTLIELLAVIVILAVIALIAVPVIMNIINKSNKSALKDTAYGIISAGELYFAERQLDLNGMDEDKEFNLSEVNEDLRLKGEVPNGKMIINTEGQVALAVENGRYCITKGFDDTDVTVTEDVENCNLPSNEGGVNNPEDENDSSDTTEKTLSQLITGTNACTTNKTAGACALGTKFVINVSDNEPKDFYVIKDEGTKVTLIMSENIGVNVKWTEEDDNSNGPIRAINYLEEMTDEEWGNIPENSYTYSGLPRGGTTKIYDDITVTMRARMATYADLDYVLTANNGSLPDYVYSGNDYWTSTSFGSDQAVTVSSFGFIDNCYSSTSLAYTMGVRPVIELSK